MSYAAGKDWTNVSFEVGRLQLREWRETSARRSEEVVELWEHVVSRSPSSLGDELWIVYEQPLNTLYLRRLADIRYTQGGQENIELARAYYEQAAKLNPVDLRALYGIVLCTNYLSNHMKGSGGDKKRDLIAAGGSAIDKILAIYEEYRLKKRVCLIREVLILQNNTTPHTTGVAQQKLMEMH
ncbi:hypothetical protein NECAME_06033 [Necator americanus]|uniref:ER membrane protein complex subunit 2 n=1 Tax=Necator americanus TaxID=51031 RepID=W2TYP0_NECAM|nr:hypothetical protein NECAME_06033 [Necator americanus]ETN86152.1 hypothetical protein NECAME_06033 [Necator americanus]